MDDILIPGSGSTKTNNNSNNSNNRGDVRLEFEAPREKAYGVYLVFKSNRSEFQDRTEDLYRHRLFPIVWTGSGSNKRGTNFSRLTGKFYPKAIYPMLRRNSSRENPRRPIYRPYHRNIIPARPCPVVVSRRRSTSSSPYDNNNNNNDVAAAAVAGSFAYNTTARNKDRHHHQ